MMRSLSWWPLRRTNGHKHDSKERGSECLVPPIRTGLTLQTSIFRKKMSWIVSQQRQRRLLCFAIKSLIIKP